MAKDKETPTGGAWHRDPAVEKTCPIGSCRRDGGEFRASQRLATGTRGSGQSYGPCARNGLLIKKRDPNDLFKRETEHLCIRPPIHGIGRDPTLWLHFSAVQTVTDKHQPLGRLSTGRISLFFKIPRVNFHRVQKHKVLGRGLLWRRRLSSGLYGHC